MKKVIVIGGGAAGILAALGAAETGAAVCLLDKMPRLGKKLLITGKGRCNITNSCDIGDFINNIPGNGIFLHSAFRNFDNNDILALLSRFGLLVKTERGGRVFPISDKASDVVDALLRALTEREVQIKTGCAVEKISVADKRVCGVLTAAGEIKADRVILAAGGASYPATGSNGDSYRLAAAVGHKIMPLRPSLVPLEVAEEWIGDLQGVSLKNVEAALIYDGKRIATEFGEMLFTHYGLSGPIILTLSHKAAELLQEKEHKEVVIEVNLKPALTPEMLDRRLQRDFAKYARKQFQNSLHDLLPSKLIGTVVELSYIEPEKPVHQITKKERWRLVEVLTHLQFTIIGTRPLREAIVTAGGICVKELNPHTMESKLIKGLFAAGEVIDIDGYTGGFNLQAAFSTGWTAGINAAQ